MSDGKWSFHADGAVGCFPITRDLAVHVRPKVPVARLFAMMQVAWDTPAFEPFKGEFECKTVDDLFDSMAVLLARRVLDRACHGFYRAYLSKDEPLAAIRGRIIASELAKPFVDPRLPCRFDEHTADTVENRIVAWTLHRIALLPILRADARLRVKKAFHALPGDVTLRPCRPEDCLGRTYNRLNADYRMTHALCWFFLANSCPDHEAGDRAMLPFAIDMPKLFEAFVAAWLRNHLPDGWHLRTQESLMISQAHGLHIRPDLIIRGDDGRPRLVLDTKYKTGSELSNADLYQVIAYAHRLGCPEAVLIYPRPLMNPLDDAHNGIRVRTISFDIGNFDLEAAGREMLAGLHQQKY